jgi:hypothetical protein
MAKRTISKQETQEIDDRAGFIRFSRTDESTPAEHPAGGPNKLVVELTLNGAGDARHRVYEANVPPAVIAWLNKLCDDAATELEG